MTQHRDAFGKLLVSPDKLPADDRVQVLRESTGVLQASDDIRLQWVGGCLSQLLQHGGAWDAVFGVRPPRGSRRTVANILRSERVNRMLLELSRVCGGDKAASAALHANTPPPAAAGLVAELRRLRAPKSPDAFSRARRKLAPHTR